MDPGKVKEYKDKLLNGKFSFTIMTDENYSYSHIPNNESSRIFFDDSSNTAVAVRINDYGNLSFNIIEYDRILQFEIICDNNEKDAKDLVQKMNTSGLLSVNQYSDISKFINDKYENIRNNKSK